MSDTPSIRPEPPLTLLTAPALDKSLLVFSKVETDFLHDTVSQDDAEMHARIYAVQDRYEDALRTQM